MDGMAGLVPAIPFGEDGFLDRSAGQVRQGIGFPGAGTDLASNALAAFTRHANFSDDAATTSCGIAVMAKASRPGRPALGETR
jgi:hypothetical protein